VYLLAPKPSLKDLKDKSHLFVLWFEHIDMHDVGLVGGKNASLGEMYQNLTAKGMRIPNGFAVTSYAYRYLLTHGGILDQIKALISDLDTRNINNLEERGHKIRTLIKNAPFPVELRHAIILAYQKLCKEYGKDCDVAVRSSATAEDLPDASFAGQQETYLNIRGEDHLIDACRNCFASLFTNRAISYREDKGFDHFSVALSIGVQKMVRSDLACSGVMFTIDTETGFKDAVFITGAYGLGENVVQGKVNPDEYYVHKPTLKKGFHSIISKQLGTKSRRMIYDMQGLKTTTKDIPVSFDDQRKFVLSDDEILLLAKWGCLIEDHYTTMRAKYTPMDIEWAKDGRTGKLFIVQARPETVMSQKDINTYEEYVLDKSQKLKSIIKGYAIGQKIGAGQAHIIKDVKDLSQFKKGEVLVTDTTDPDWEPIMKIASGIVTNKGGRTSHAAIVSRELGIPCVVGTEKATQIIKQEQKITISCIEGDEGHIYDGILKYSIKKHNLGDLPKTRTKIMLNLGNPDLAFATALLPNDGVGLAREEFIMSGYIQVHPLALLNYDKLKHNHEHHELIQKIDRLTESYHDKKQFFVDKLAEGAARIAGAFYPKPVILRFSDFKSNEYANLLGGHLYEPKEANPMIGWRGASRYYHPVYAEAFALECKAIKKVREQMGLVNLEVMIPMCRTLDEARKVLAVMKKYGLERGKNGLKVICMCEVPANVLLANEFLDLFDGFSIGSNDLTQFTLAVDRDSTLVAPIFDERNPAVLHLMEHVITIAKQRKKYIGICGQGPSDHPDLAQFLVKCGIDSVSLNPDTVIKTRMLIAKAEKS